MKTFGAFKNRRFPDTVRNHALTQLAVAQIGIGF